MPPTLRHLAAIAAIAAAWPAVAQDWASHCAENLCVFQRAVSDGKGTNVQLDMLIDTEHGQTSLLATVPLGAALEPGVRITAADFDWEVPLKVCQPAGCRASRTLDAGEVTAIMQADALDIAYFRFGEDRPVSVTLPLGGLTAAIAAQR